MIFEESEDSEYPGFNAFAILVIFVYNAMFLLEWCFLFLESFNFKNERMRIIVGVYGALICKRKMPKLVLDDFKKE